MDVIKELRESTEYFMGNSIKIAYNKGFTDGMAALKEHCGLCKEEISSDSDEFKNLINVLEGVWISPAELLDRDEMLNKIMEAYRKYRAVNEKEL